MSERASDIAEKRAFDYLKKKLPVAKVISSPAGSATTFPDFGFRLEIDNKKVDLHFEFKDDWKTQMGSMRDWIFDGNVFSTPNKDTDKETLISIMNSIPDAKAQANRLLKDIKKYYSNKVQKLYSGSLTVLPTSERKKYFLNLVSNMKNFQIANIASPALGQKIVDHYIKKFKSNLQSDADFSILFFMIGDTLWYVGEDGTADSKTKLTIASYFDAKSITVLGSLVANLEVRIQPRPSLKSILESPSKEIKGIDVMASYRLKSRPSGGTKVM